MKITQEDEDHFQEDEDHFKKMKIIPFPLNVPVILRRKTIALLLQVVVQECHRVG
ncbi:MAG: hypothetical protein MZW92_69425 [Comamonadaceae bacterium]|jgi:hypothetical protein|nr:hypothetical protein [Comamonadaceae bacterium]